MSTSKIPSSIVNLSPEIKERFRQILLNIPENLQDPQEDAVCFVIVQSLSDEEIEHVARISYAYWVMSLLGETETVATPEVAKRIAKKVARWHLRYLTSNTPSSSSKYTDATLKRLKEAIQMRKDKHLELLRTCFDEDITDEISLRFRNNITSDLKKQIQIYHGQDVQGRAVLLKVPRMVGGATEEEYMDHQLYVAEKAAAVTEFVSNGQQETICAIFSMKHQNSSVTPSLSWQLATIQVLQQLYPGRMAKVIVLDAPFLIRQLFNAIRPFLSKSLTESTFLVAGKAAVEKQLQENLPKDDIGIITEDGKLRDPVDIDKYLKETPFFCPYEYKL